VKRIITILLTICLLFTGCAQFVESEKQRIGKDFDKLTNTISQVAEQLDGDLNNYSGEPVTDEEIFAEPAYPLCISTLSTDKSFFYNPFGNYGFICPANWYASRSDDFTLRYCNLTVSELENADSETLADIAYIPDTELYFSANSYWYTADIYMHNLAADKNFGSNSIDGNEEYVIINQAWLTECGYQNVTRKENIFVGDDCYRVLYAKSPADTETEYIIILASRMITQDVAVNFELRCFGIKQYDFFLKKIFNNKTKPGYSSTIINRLEREAERNSRPIQTPVPGHIEQLVNKRFPGADKHADYILIGIAWVIAYFIYHFVRKNHFDPNATPYINRRVASLLLCGIFFCVFLVLFIVYHFA